MNRSFKFTAIGLLFLTNSIGFCAEPKSGFLKCFLQSAQEFFDTSKSEALVAKEFFSEEPTADAIENLKKIENDALRAMKNVLPKSSVEQTAAVRDWFNSIRKRQQNGQRLSVMEHSALTYALKSKVFEADPDPSLLEEIRQALKQSWIQLTGKAPTSPENVLARLPKQVLRKASRDEVLFHQAIFNEGRLGFLGSMKNLSANYIPTSKDVIYSLVLGSSLFSHTGSEVLAGMMEGYALNTFLEYSLHRYIGHASKKTLARLDSLGWFGRWLNDLHFSHAVVHHGSYGANYVDRFAPVESFSGDVEEFKAAKKDKIDKLIEKQGPRALRNAESSDYGVSLASLTKSTLSVMPVSTAMTAFTNFIAPHFGFHPDLSFDAAMMGTSVLFLPTSKFLHPYLHMTRERAMKKAGPLMRWLLDTRAVSWIARSHFAHHEDAGRTNQNLNTGADFFFGYHPASVEQLLALKKYEAIF